MQAQPKYRYRLTFSKGYRVKYVSHLDLVQTWTRAFRRAEIPLVYSQGFNPQARIQIAISLPMGYMGSAEVMDIYLTRPMPSPEILSRVQPNLPPDFQLLATEEVDLHAPTLESRLQRAEYTVTVETPLPDDELQTRINTLLGQETVIETRTRRKKAETLNLRPMLHQLSLITKAEQDAILHMQLTAGAHGNLRPDTVLKSLQLHQTWYQVERTKLIFDI